MGILVSVIVVSKTFNSVLLVLGAWEGKEVLIALLIRHGEAFFGKVSVDELN